MPQEATPETFADLTSDGAVLVDFWGPRCAPCLAQMPHVAKLEEDAAGAFKVVKVLAPENRQVCRDLKVFGLPTYIAMRDGQEVDRISGNDVDMDAVRALAERLTA
jgi:thioredoxin 1